MEKYLLVIDMQKDFVDGALGTKEAEAIVSAAAGKTAGFEGTVIFTQDTHSADYLSTQEGKKLPVEHCILGTEGHKIIPELREAAASSKVFCKGTFGSLELMEYLASRKDEIESIEIIGLCTDICVVSNALLLKAAMPEIPIIVDSKCCAGVTPKKHEAALETMRSCQIEVI